MIKSLLPFSLSRDKRRLVPNPFIFGEGREALDFPELLDEHTPAPRNEQENSNLMLDRLQYIKLDSEYETTFWRYQNNSDACLSTIEAAYYCLREIAEEIPHKCTRSPNFQFPASSNSTF